MITKGRNIIIRNCFPAFLKRLKTTTVTGQKYSVLKDHWTPGKKVGLSVWICDHYSSNTVTVDGRFMPHVDQVLSAIKYSKPGHQKWIVFYCSCWFKPNTDLSYQISTLMLTYQRKECPGHWWQLHPYFGPLDHVRPTSPNVLFKWFWLKDLRDKLINLILQSFFFEMTNDLNIVYLLEGFLDGLWLLRPVELNISLQDGLFWNKGGILGYCF